MTLQLPAAVYIRKALNTFMLAICCKVAWHDLLYMLGWQCFIRTVAMPATFGHTSVAKLSSVRCMYRGGSGCLEL